MLSYIDLILIVVVGITAFAGYKLGIVRMAVSLLSFFVAIGVALFFYKPLALILTEKTPIDDYIISHIVQSGDSIKKTNETPVVVETPALSSGDSISQANNIESLLSGLPNVLVENLNLEETKNKAKYEIAKKASEIIMNILSLIIIYLVVRITLFVASILLTGLMKKIPVLNKINEVLGLFLGIIVGAIEIYIIFAIITFVSSIIDISGFVGAIKASAIAKILFENNLLINLLF